MGLYISGYGFKSDEELKVQAACRKHDPDLVFQRSARTGNYTVFQRMMRDSVYVKHADAADLEQGDLFPLRAFPNKRMPTPDEVSKWLYENDRERGDLLDKVQRHNKSVQARMDKDVKQEASARAEFLEHGFRMLGEDTGRTVSTSNTGKRRRSFG